MISSIGDSWSEEFPKKWPQFVPSLPPIYTSNPVSRTEFEALREEVLELKKLLQAAKKFDEATGQRDCEMEDKVRLIKAIAKLVDVDMDDVFEVKKKQL